MVLAETSKMVSRRAYILLRKLERVFVPRVVVLAESFYVFSRVEC